MTDTRIDVRDLRVLRVRALQLAAAEGLQFTAPHALPAGSPATTPATTQRSTPATTSPLPQPAPTRPAKARPLPPVTPTTEPAAELETAAHEVGHRRVRVSAPDPELVDAETPAAVTATPVALTPAPAEDALDLLDFSARSHGSELDDARARMTAMLRGTVGRSVERGAQRAQEKRGS